MKSKISRRSFIHNATLAGLSFALPASAAAAVAKTRGLKIGVISDLHQDIMHDGYNRMKKFTDSMKKENPDAIMQLGDFACPGAKNKAVIDLFNQAHPTALHVIGNHDNDNGHTHQQCVEIWGMPATYYEKKVKDFRVIVLNGNDKGSPVHKGGYPAYIGPEQVQWLQQKLSEIAEPVIIACHQPITGWASIDNAARIRQIISDAKDRVVLVLNGHTHIDMLDYVDGVPYLTINSASYFWMGEKYQHESYSKEVHQSHPWIASTCPYQDALFATITIHPEKKLIEVKGKETNWVGKTPRALNYTEPPLTIEKEIIARISSRKIKPGK